MVRLVNVSLNLLKIKNNNMQPEVVMMGLGYIGLPTAALIASNGVNVHGVDINLSLIHI